MITIITEKPSVAKDIARVLSINSKSDGFFFNNDYFVTWAFGHLIELANPDAYGFHKWDKANLPIIPLKFKRIIKQIKNKDGKSSNNPGIEKQIKIINDLFDKSESIIVATDAGREGELIFRYIYEYLACLKPFKRLWISSLTDSAIEQGFKNLKDGKEYDSLYYSARARSEADWLVGMNGTQSLSLAINKGLLSLGRVQTPTLALICRRFVEFSTFKPSTTYILRICCAKNKFLFNADYFENDKIVHFQNKEDGQIILNKLLDSALVSDISSEIKKEASPLLYDLTALQIDANKRFSLSADDTLKAAQELYEGKFITYPRTGSRYISEDVFETIPSLIKELTNNKLFSENATKLLSQKLNERCVNAEKVTDHHALLITHNIPGNLNENLLNIYNLIAGRMLESFSGICEKRITSISLFVDSNETIKYKFIAKSLTIIILGWRSILNIPEEDNQDNEVRIPELIINEILPIKNKDFIEVKSKPKPLHTEATLLKEMENCGKEIQEDELRLAMKETGLGTPATRANIIETLFKRTFIERKKKSLVPTDLGLMEYNLVKDKKISQPLLTGEWEKKLEDIRLGMLLPKDFDLDIKKYTTELTLEMLSISGSGLFTKDSIVCPKCKKGEIIVRQIAAGCSLYKEGCDFSIFRLMAKKSLTDTDIKDLLKKGKTKLIKGFTSKLDKSFDATLILDASFKVNFKFDNK